MRDGYVIQSTETGRYVSQPGSLSSYTNRLERARIFESYEDADGNRCPENERVVPVDSLIGRRVK